MAKAIYAAAWFPQSQTFMTLRLETIPSTFHHILPIIPAGKSARGRRSPLGDHPNPAMRDHLKSGQGREGFWGRTGRQKKIVEKTAAEAALEIALRFPLSHNLCDGYHLAVRNNA